MGTVFGQITRRLLAKFGPNSAGWNPPRDAKPAVKVKPGDVKGTPLSRGEKRKGGR